MIIRLDFSIKDPRERVKLVQRIVDNAAPERLTPKYLEILADYIVFVDTKQKDVISENHLVTIHKREISFQGLAAQLENGEDGIYNMIANDKNILFTPKISITPEDIEAMPALKELHEAIEVIEQEEKSAEGHKKYLLKKQLIEMRQDQYIIKGSYRPTIYFMSGTRGITKLDLSEHVTISADGTLSSDAIISLLNPAHVSALLCNYSKLKEDTYGKFESDAYFLLLDLDNLIEKTLKDKYPLYYDLLIYKIDGRQNAEIQSLLEQKHGVRHTVEYISALWRKKIPKLLADKAQEDYLVWYYTTQERGKWKRCSQCGQIKLAHSRFFTRNGTSRDGFYSICKECRNKKAFGQKGKKELT